MTENLARNDDEFQRIVCEKANHICQGCIGIFVFPCCFDSRGKNMFVCAHHIKSKKAHPELRFVVENGLCLCKECHTKIHQGYSLERLFLESRRKKKVIK